MILVLLVESPAGGAKVIPIAGPARLLDVCDDVRGPVRFGCRAARCTTCRIEVLEGASNLLPASGEEAELLSSISAPKSVRLACQAVLREGEGLLKLRWIGPDRA